MYQGELMLSAASKIFSVTISILPLRASHRLLPPAVADRVAALPMKEDRRGKIKSYPPATHSDFNRGPFHSTCSRPDAAEAIVSASARHRLLTNSLPRRCLASPSGEER